MLNLFYKLFLLYIFVYLFKIVVLKNPKKVIFDKSLFSKIVVSVVEENLKISYVKYTIKSFTNINEKLCVFVTLTNENSCKNK